MSADGIYLLKKGYYEKPIKLAPYIIRYGSSDILLYSGKRVEVLNSTSGTALLFNGSKGPSPMFWYTLRRILPPGNYTVTLRIMISPLEKGVSSEEVFTLECVQTMVSML
jgi:hypothetical protein